MSINFVIHILKFEKYGDTEFVPKPLFTVQS